MADQKKSMQEFKNIILEKSKTLNCEKEIIDELKFLEQIEDKDGKPFLESIEKIYKDYKGKVGNLNNVNLWTVYVLGLTKKKPAKGAKLQKRRVYARSGYPDIDSDFDFEFQYDIINYIRDKYGHENVSRIGAYGALKLKSYITRLYKAIDPDGFYKTWTGTDGKVRNSQDEWREQSNKKVREIIKALYGDRENVVKLKIKDEEGNEHVIENVNDAAKYSEDFKFYCDKYPALLSYSRDLEGLLSQYSIHPAGIVISSVPLSEIAPVRHTKDENSDNIVYATQFTNEELEQFGLIKFDVLALSTLSVIRHCCELIKENYDLTIDIENLPLDDKKTFELYRSGRLSGVFQCESFPMQETMKQIGVDRFEDISVGISLFRPGPMDSIPEYCNRKKGISSISYFDKSLEPFVKPYLQNTYGIICYQEQIMQICNSLAGLSISEGYQVIKAVSKKKGLDKYKTIFVNGCKNNGITEKIATDYWDKVITPFASYGFNKSHALAYAVTSYQTAYLKANFPEEFMVAYMNVEMGRSKYDKVTKLEKECSKMDILILPRKLNTSDLKYKIVRKKDTNNGITQSEIMPPIRCKGLPIAAAQNIVENGPYDGIRSLAEKTSPEVVDATCIEALADAGFFANNRKSEIVSSFSVIREDMKKNRRKGRQSVNLFE